MKTARLSLMMLACAAAMPALAQNTGSYCGNSNYDRSNDQYTIVRPDVSMPNQQCFITVVPKGSWGGGTNDMGASQFIEGNYQITLSGAGGGGGAGGRRTDGSGGLDATVTTVSRYLAPGTYRVTLGNGGMGGTPSGQGSLEGAPSSLSNANTGETVAGFPGAERWTSNSPPQARVTGSTAGGSSPSGTTGAGGDGGGSGKSNTSGVGARGGNGFMKFALADAIQPRAVAPAPVFVAERAAPAQPTYVAPQPAAMRPAKRDRN
jgi:hypothetical protein